MLYTVGSRTAEKLNRMGILTVRDIQTHEEDIIRAFGKQGQWMTRLARGMDDRKVSPYKPEDAKSISREITFQADVEDFGLLRDVLLLLTLKLTYGDMKTITRSRLIPSSRNAQTIFEEAIRLLDQVPHRPVRLVGTGIYHLTGEYERQLRIDDLLPEIRDGQREKLNAALEALGQRYGLDFAGKLDKVFHGETLYKTIEYMRKHRGNAG